MSLSFLRESTKFRILSAPIEVPGVCASCGSSSTNDRDYIDFDMFVEYVGVTYFCTFCFTECANALGWINPEQARRLEDQVEYYAKQATDFYTKDKALNDAITLLRDSGLFDLVDGPAGIPNEVPSKDLNGSSESYDSGITEIERESNKQDSKQGSSNLSADGSNDLFGDVFKL